MIKRIIAHGCSFTYGQELEDPKTQAWPMLVADNFNAEILNLAYSGYSNDGIIYDILRENIKSNDDFVIIMWTWYHRLLFVDNDGWYTCFPEKLKLGHRGEISKLLMSTTDQKWLYERWIDQVVLLQEYFKSNNIRYLFINAFDNNQDMISTLLDKIDRKYYVGWPNFNFDSLAFDNYTRLPLGHPDVLSHRKIAEIISNKIEEIYDTKKI